MIPRLIFETLLVMLRYIFERLLVDSSAVHVLLRDFLLLFVIAISDGGIMAMGGWNDNIGYKSYTQ